MPTDVTVPHQGILSSELLIALFKKFAIFFLIYFFGCLKLPLIFPCVTFALIYLNDRRADKKRRKLRVGRRLARGHEKEVILQSLSELPTWISLNLFSEKERVEWVNLVVKRLWNEVNEYAQKWLPEVLEPSVRSYVSDFKLDHVVLGNVPLRVDAVRICEGEDSRKIVMDLDISYAGDCYVTFRTFKFTGGIRDIQLHGSLRVVLTPLLNKIPFIGGLQAYFTHPPKIDFDLIKATHILDIPGIRSKIKDTTMNVINSMMLFPNYYPINFTQGVNVAKLAVFRIEGILRVHVIEAKDLVNKDLIGKSDPYVVLKVGLMRVETKVVENCLNPQFDFWCEFEIGPNSELRVEVWDRDEGTKDDSLGETKIDISQVAKAGQAELSLPLEGVEKGTIYLRLTWLTLSQDYSDLEAAIKEARHLNPLLHSALLMLYLESSLNLPSVKENPPDAYVELEVENQTRQTEVEKRSFGPAWNKGFTIMLYNPKTAVLSIKIREAGSGRTFGEVLFGVDNLQSEEKMLVQRRTLFCEKPHSNVSICCSMKLRILKNDHVEERREEGKTKKMVKQASTVSNKSVMSQNSSALSESTFSDSEAILDERSAIGRIKLSIVYSQDRQKLSVEVHEIEFAKKFSNVEPIVLLTLIQKSRTKNKEKKTKGVKNSINPIYNEKFEYLILDKDLNDSSLILDVRSETRLFNIKKKFLGRTIISMTKCIHLSAPYTDWFELKEKKEAIEYGLFN